MSDDEDHTLFKPLEGARGARGGGGGVPGGQPGMMAQMPMMGSMVSAGGGEDEDGPSPVEAIKYAYRAAKRRTRLTVGVLCLGAVLTTAAAALAPRTYHTEATIQIVQTSLPSALQQQTGMGGLPDDRRLNAEFQQQLLSRESIAEIVSQQSLVDRWDNARPPYRRLMDALTLALGGTKPSGDQKRAALYGKLEHDLRIGLDSGTVTIDADWSDPDGARDVVAGAVQRFRDARYQTEVGVLKEQKKTLEVYSKMAHDDLLAATARMRTEKERENAKEPGKPGRRTVSFLGGGVDAATSAKATDADAKLRQTQEDLKSAQDAKAKRLAELNAQMSTLRATLAPQHPEVIALQAQLDLAAKDPPELTALKALERQQLTEAAAAHADSTKSASRMVVLPTASSGAGGPAGAAPSMNAPGATAALANLPPSPTGNEDPQTAFEMATRKYESLAGRLDAAQIELDTAESAFNRKYVVSHPPEKPLGATKPVAAIVGLSGMFLVAALALFFAGLADRLSGVFFEGQKVRDRLRLPILGEAKEG